MLEYKFCKLGLRFYESIQILIFNQFGPLNVKLRSANKNLFYHIYLYGKDKRMPFETIIICLLLYNI